jgi:hypothetical protein
MRRRTFLQSLAGALYAMSPRRAWSAERLAGPICIYNNWSAYDELSDAVRLDETLAMRQFDELLRMRGQGVHVDGYMLDAFWFDPKGGYRTFRAGDWPNGPDRWLERCRRSGLMPGLWFGSNALVQIEPIAEWQDSVTARKGSLSMFEGGFLPHFMQTLDLWYSRGVRAFKFDFTDLNAATPDAERALSKAEIGARNTKAFRSALVAFRDRHPDALLLGYNGLGGDFDNTTYPFKQTVDVRWLDAFDSLYCGDPRPSDTPAMRFWRAVDTYSDQMARRYEQNGMPLGRIDNCAFMMGKTGTCYYRGKAGWKGSLILSLARGGRMNTYYGNLEQFTDDDARWFAKAQSMWLPLTAHGTTRTFGPASTERGPYGFVSESTAGALVAVVNPDQAIRTMFIPGIDPWKGARLLFADRGYVPEYRAREITLGPEQLVVVGCGTYSDARYELGSDDDIAIPMSIAPLDVASVDAGHLAAAGLVRVPAGKTLRVVVRQQRPDGVAARTYAGGPPKGTKMGAVLKIGATQSGRELPVEVEYDRMIWSGLSWAVGEVRASDLRADVPVEIGVSSREHLPVHVSIAAFAVTYGE